MEYLSTHKNLKIGLFVTILLLIVLTFSSCMAMAPGHLVQSARPDYSIEETIVHIDPVCGKEVNNLPDGLSYLYNGRSYYFHTADCRTNFIEAPGKYLHPEYHSYRHHSSRWFLGMGGTAMGAMMLIMVL